MRTRRAQRLALPFFGDEHRTFERALDDWCGAQRTVPHDDVGAATRAWVHRLGDAGWLRHTVPARWGGLHEMLDSRSLCVAREVLAWHDGLADFAFAMQGLGSGPLALAGRDALRETWLPRVARGDAIAAFALTEPDAGSDVGAMRMSATRDGDAWVLHGTKTWISNGGIADFYCVFARSDAASTGARGITAFFVPADTPGLTIAERLEVIAPHPLATLQFSAVRVPDTHRLGGEGEGFKLAMRTLDIFRTSVAAAALGFAGRALDETLAHTSHRQLFGAPLGDLPVAQATIGDLCLEFDAAGLLVARAAWQRDVAGDPRATSGAAMAKLAATEWGQHIIDQAVQLHGARGVQHGSVVERLYREIRALRIYEGASEVQRLIIGREATRAAREAAAHAEGARAGAERAGAEHAGAEPTPDTGGSAP
jgi:acyl-CoA dehydrogenase